ncbi:MAG: rane protein of unknown function [Candidatus Saccharibacteria bacterium]|nr:rane protein of unknown function [Candidatus Saccharibacteria bacterium]
MLARILSIVGLVSAGLLLILVTTTTPGSVGALGILAVFLLTYITILCLLTFLVWLLAKVINKLMKELHLSRKQYTFPLRKSYYYSTVLALGPVIIISLQAVGGVGIYELSLVIALLVLGCLYVSRRVA